MFQRKFNNISDLEHFDIIQYYFTGTIKCRTDGENSGLYIFLPMDRGSVNDTIDILRRNSSETRLNVADSS